MEILSVYSESFKPYGKVLEGFDTAELIEAMKKIPMPESGTAYTAGDESLEATAIYDEFKNRAYGGMPIQLGICWGYNTTLNALEYHRDSEVNVGVEDFILLIAKEDEIENYELDTAKVKAFRVPAGVVIEVFGTTLHYAPCHTNPEKGFRTAVVLPKGTNTARPEIEIKSSEDKLLRACNKWLLCHPDSKEASQGAFVGLKGENIDIANLL